MTLGLALLAWLLAIPIILALGVFTIECIFGLLRIAEPPLPSSQNAKCLVLVPAHDEEAGIARTVASLQADLPMNGRILVVADNCTDSTAEVAAAAGAEVVVRHDPERRSKAYALEFGRSHLRQKRPEERPDVVAVIDADCAVDPGTLTALTDSVLAFRRPVQAPCLLVPEGESPVVQISNFAFFVKNWVRQKGLRRLGAPAVLNGTGMAFPWSQFDKTTLASSSLAEDLDIGLQLACAGAPPRFITRGTVWSAPASETAAAAQKARWEGGFLSAARRRGLPLLADGLRGGRWPILWLGLHLLVPPLTLLLFASALCLLLVTGLAFASGHFGPVYAVSAGLSMVLLCAGGAWVAGGSRYLPSRTLLRLPAYFVWKALLYARMIKKPEKNWIRTER